jgi:hypothetical protein
MPQGSQEALYKKEEEEKKKYDPAYVKPGAWSLHLQGHVPQERDKSPLR